MFADGSFLRKIGQISDVKTPQFYRVSGLGLRTAVGRPVSPQRVMAPKVG